MHAPASLPWLDPQMAFPPVDQAWGPLDPAPGLLCGGADLSVARLVDAYSRTIFPWFSAGDPVLWWSPDPRMVLDPQTFKCPLSLRKSIRQGLRQGRLRVSFDAAFDDVINACANTPRPGQDGTWIVPAMVQAYQSLHHAGYAHSVEVWWDEQLVGGLYGVQLGGMIFGESMFSWRSNASKMALAALAAYAKHHRIGLIDCQQHTAHLASMGATDISRSQLVSYVEQAITHTPAPWQFDPLYWELVLTNPTP